MTIGSVISLLRIPDDRCAIADIAQTRQVVWSSRIVRARNRRKRSAVIVIIYYTDTYIVLYTSYCIVSCDATFASTPKTYCCSVCRRRAAFHYNIMDTPSEWRRAYIIYTRARNARGMMVPDDEGLSESLLLLLLSLYTLTPRPYIFNKRSDAAPPRVYRRDYCTYTVYACTMYNNIRSSQAAMLRLPRLSPASGDVK